jgi:hypothetical protein
MVNSQDSKIMTMLAPVSANGAAFTTIALDTVQQGNKADWATVYVYFGAVGANITAGNFKLTESDVDSGYADIAGTTALTVTGTTDNGKIWAFQLDLRKRKRFIKLALTAGAGATLAAAWGELSRQKEAPSTAATRGVTGAEIIL